MLDPNKWQVTTYFGRGCELMRPASYACEDAEIEKKLLTERFDIIVTTSYRDRVKDYRVTPERYKTAWDALTAAGSRILVVADNPRVTEEAYACLTRASFGGGDGSGDCGMSRSEGLSPADPLITAAGLVPQATLLDLTRYYCTEERCPMVIGNVIVYRDTFSHLTATFASTLAPSVETAVRQALTSETGR